MSASSAVPAPRDLLGVVFDALAEKAALPLRTMLVLGILAGLYIGFGGLFATIALTEAGGLPYGIGQVVAGLVFAAGLGLVMIAGAGLFTGNTMMTGAVLARQIALPQALTALLLVFAANFAGALLLALLVYGAGLHESRDGAIGRTAVDLARGKMESAFLATLASGILANMLVCLAVWSAYAGQSVTQKLAGLTLPVAAFVAAGLEHSVANMYLLPYGWLVAASMPGQEPLALAGVVGNLVPATIGNVIGGAFIASAYWLAFAPMPAARHSRSDAPVPADRKERS
ncbi:MAG: formate/nitrite transporter family protein [Bosea sp. (in: a-proteobacteria)]|uniref:formate/nitrite transporter family protein n=1 Tax=Bosea sp. (in: a-proteobacteria) TaxID=1871050 RepID=UPI0027346C2F|nr:formate/nitrite transporter family protein [Bosea sp. (in: a-proteobacteria)]MDP3257435.1 formate/nitrite transporter family protein [Bosea sp. (in: a-proteobacteria)]MDP3319403.1 formate/nitrite transporter family protein [Bosea sp. (in: a-proteobacteria)]